MFHEIIRHKADPFLSPDHRLQRSPFRFEPLFVVDFFAFGSLLKIRVDLRTLFRLQLQFGQAALVINWHRRFVFHGALNVVDRNVVTKNRSRIRVAFFDWRPSEANEGSVWKSIAHVPGKTADEIVLAAMRFISDDHDIPPLGKQWMRSALFVRKELVNRREDHPAARDL